MVAYREDLTDIEARVRDAERGARELPHREKYLLLVAGFMRDYIDLHLKLVDRVERELGPDAASP
jgi:hypothetical protein